MIDLGVLSRPTALEDGWRKLLADLYREAGGEDDYDPLATNPELLFAYAHLDLDAWQLRVLKSEAWQLLMCCSRQSGKSTVAAALALKTALSKHTAPAEVLIVSRTLRQSAELLLKVKDLHRWFRSRGQGKGRRNRGKPWQPKPVRQLEEEQTHGQEVDELAKVGADSDSVLKLQLNNGSRIISLPGKADTFVGFSPDLLIIDEAARVPDDTYRACRPMLAVSGGRLVCLSTPFGKRGFFWDEWSRCETAISQGRKAPWETYRVPVNECPRIPADFLEDERLALGERWWRQEYFCSFEDPVGAVFTSEQIKGMLAGTGGALW